MTNTAISEQSCNSAVDFMKMRCERLNKEIGHLNENDGYNCPLCLNKGGLYEVKEYDGRYYETFVMCKCQRIRNAIKRLNKSGLKDTVKKYTFDNFTVTNEFQKQIKADAISYIENGKGKWFFIGGQSGCGKTHVCTAIAIKLLKMGYDTKYMLWRDEIVKIKASVNNNEEYEALVNDIKNADVLYIDDLFKTVKGADGVPQRPTTADINLAFEILNYRYNKNLPFTIISSECTLSDLINIDEAISGRIAEKCKSESGNYCLSIKPDAKKNYRLNNIKEL